MHSTIIEWEQPTTNSAKNHLHVGVHGNSSFCGDPGTVNKKALVVLNQTKSSAICKLKQLHKHLWGLFIDTCTASNIPYVKMELQVCIQNQNHMMKSSIDNPLKLATQNDDVVFRSVGNSRGRRQVIQTIIVNAQS